MDVQQRAKAATQVMVDQVMVGKYAEVIEMMNPDYLKKTATQKRITVTKLKEQLAKQLETIGKNGVTLDATITRAPKGAFEVDYGFEEEIINGKKVKVANYRSWMVFIPTVTDLQVLDNHQESPTLKRYRKFGFQVAISPKKGEKWTFIGGSGVNALELRKLFPYLPKTDKEFDFPVRKIVERPAKK